MNSGYGVIVLVVSAVSGISHLIAASAPGGSVAHWGQFIAGWTFLILALTIVSGMVDQQDR